MVERVARAMCAPFDPDEYVFLGTHKKRWKTFEEQARAVIKAMREPTEAMVKAGGNAQTITAKANRVLCYRAMIDAALGDPD